MVQRERSHGRSKMATGEWNGMEGFALLPTEGE